MAEQSQPGYAHFTFPQVGIVQNIEDVSIVGRERAVATPPSFRIPSRDAFLAVHRSILRISSSVELSASSKASSQETLNEPSAVARWSERFEEAFQSETSLTDMGKISEEEENERRKDPCSKKDEFVNSCTPLVISPDCHSITSESITGFEFPAVNSNKTTLEHIATNGDATSDRTEHDVNKQEDWHECSHNCCCSTGYANDKHYNSAVKCVCVVFALISVIFIPFLISHLLYAYGRSKQTICSRRGYQIVSVVYCLLTYLLLFGIVAFAVVVLLCTDCIDLPW